MSHSYEYQVDGEGLPEHNKKYNKKAFVIAISLTLFFIVGVNYLTMSIKSLMIGISNIPKDTPSLFDILEVDMNSAFKISNAITPVFNVQWGFVLLVIATILFFLIYSKFNYKDDSGIAYGQKGDSRFTTLEEIKQQYIEIPEKEQEFKGVGGIPISHHKNKYYIDVDPVNSCILGVSRSGKGEVIITPTIDILSRAKEKSSLVVNDPKGELYAGSKDTLERRGYDVQVLNLQDPLQSMSYNPLELVKVAWLQGDEQEAGKIANSISFSLYNDPNAGENAFFNDGAQNAVTAIILAIVEYCVENNCPEKITMYNVAEMLNELGTLYYKEDDQDITEKNALDEYFKNLPQGHVAKKRYGSTSFAGEKTRGSILSTANQGLQPFVDPLFARMTSRNSIDLKQIGFPKNLLGQLNHSFMNKRITVSFHKNNESKTLINTHKIKVKSEGMFSLNFNDDLEEGDLILIKYSTEDVNYKLIYQLHFEKERDSEGNIIYQKKEGNEHIPEWKRKVEVIEKVNTFPEVKQKMIMNYSNKPTAVFMIIPDYDSSNHTLASIYTKQLYTNLSQNCAETKGNKCFIRVHFLLDEFGNMPPIDDMDQVMTVSLGRNILFNLIIQSYSQIKRKYGESAETIKENCQNHVYIMSTNADTLEELSKKAGNRTILGKSSNESHLDMDNKVTKSADQERIMTVDRLSQFIEGETMIIRSLHRQDNKRRKVRPFPIFNSKETNMPYRYQFLSDYIDTSKDLNDIDIKSEHFDLVLSDLDVNFADFIIDIVTKKKYEQAQRKSTKNKKMKSDQIKKKNDPKNIIMNRLNEALDTTNLHNEYLIKLKAIINKKEKETIKVSVLRECFENIEEKNIKRLIQELLTHVS